MLTASGTGDGAHIGILPPDRDYDATNAHQAAAPYTSPQSDPAQGGGDGRITVRYEYDTKGNMTASIDDNGNKTSWTYDSIDRKLSETKGLQVDPAASGHNTADVAATPSTIHWTYNTTTGLLDHITREDGSLITSTYDTNGADRVTSIIVTGGDTTSPILVGTTEQTFTYDGPGHRLASTDNNAPADPADDAECTWHYDSLGRIVEESQTLGEGGTPVVVSYRYVAEDHAALVYPNDRVVGYTYHAPSGALRDVMDLDAQSEPVDGPPIARYDYLGGRTLVRAMRNGVNLDLRRDDGGAWLDASGHATKWLYRDTNRQGAPTVIGFEYAYDAAGNKLYQKSVHDPRDGQRYAHDSSGRLVATKRGAFSTAPYLFDASPSLAAWDDCDAYQGWRLDGLSNWERFVTQRANQTTLTQTRTDNAFNGYAQVGGVSQIYDQNGNLTSDGQRTLKWDAFNRLREVRTLADTLVATYTYDTTGRRLRKNVADGFPGESADFHFSDWQILEDCPLATGGSLTVPVRQYTYGNHIDEVLTMDTDLTANGLCTDQSDRRLFYHQNDLLSVYGLTDLSGNVVEGREYDSYGNTTLLLDGPDQDSVVNFDSDDSRCTGSLSTSSPTGNTRAFSGKYLDSESSIYCWNNRFYDAVSGRFVGRDPLGDVDGQNLYTAYFAMFGATDPTGLFTAREALRYMAVLGPSFGGGWKEWKRFPAPWGGVTVSLS